LQAFVVLHALGSSFSLSGFLFFPEVVVDLVPDRVPIEDVRHMLALFAILPMTFVAWDVIFLIGIRSGFKRSLLIGFVAGGAGVLGGVIHLAYGKWTFMAADGAMGLLYLAITWWNWRSWPDSTE
jgi:hypothetical protein